MAYSPKNPNGQATMDNSEPVVLASNHSDVKVTLDSEAVVLGAGSASIGKLAANSGVDIGDVDIASIAAGDNNIGNIDVVTVPADPFGANADAIVSAGATGSMSAKLRRITQGLEDLKTLIVLGAGTNTIGKLAANSGVDIGDVDVTSLPKSIQGPGIPNVDSYAHAAISVSANTANQSLVSAPGASKQIWVYGIAYVVGTAAGSVSFQDEDDTAISGVMEHALNSGMAVSPSGNFSMPLWKLATNKALEVDTVTCDIEGWISYAIVSV